MIINISRIGLLFIYVWQICRALNSKRLILEIEFEFAIKVITAIASKVYKKGTIYGARVVKERHISEFGILL